MSNAHVHAPDALPSAVHDIASIVEAITTAATARYDKEAFWSEICGDPSEIVALCSSAGKDLEGGIKDAGARACDRLRTLLGRDGPPPPPDTVERALVLAIRYEMTQVVDMLLRSLPSARVDVLERGLALKLAVLKAGAGNDHERNRNVWVLVSHLSEVISDENIESVIANVNEMLFFAIALGQRDTVHRILHDLFSRTGRKLSTYWTFPKVHVQLPGVDGLEPADFTFPSVIDVVMVLNRDDTNDMVRALLELMPSPPLSDLWQPSASALRTTVAALRAVEVLPAPSELLEPEDYAISVAFVRAVESAFHNVCNPAMFEALVKRCLRGWTKYEISLSSSSSSDSDAPHPDLEEYELLPRCISSSTFISFLERLGLAAFTGGDAIRHRKEQVLRADSPEAAVVLEKFNVDRIHYERIVNEVADDLESRARERSMNILRAALRSPCTVHHPDRPPVPALDFILAWAQSRALYDESDTAFKNVELDAYVKVLFRPDVTVSEFTRGIAAWSRAVQNRTLRIDGAVVLRSLFGPVTITGPSPATLASKRSHVLRMIQDRKIKLRAAAELEGIPMDALHVAARALDANEINTMLDILSSCNSLGSFIIKGIFTHAIEGVDANVKVTSREMCERARDFFVFLREVDSRVAAGGRISGSEDCKRALATLKTVDELKCMAGSKEWKLLGGPEICLDGWKALYDAAEACVGSGGPSPSVRPVEAAPAPGPPVHAPSPSSADRGAPPSSATVSAGADTTKAGAANVGRPREPEATSQAAVAVAVPAAAPAAPSPQAPSPAPAVRPAEAASAPGPPPQASPAPSPSPADRGAPPSSATVSAGADTTKAGAANVGRPQEPEATSQAAVAVAVPAAAPAAPSPQAPSPAPAAATATTQPTSVAAEINNSNIDFFRSWTRQMFAARRDILLLAVQLGTPAFLAELLSLEAFTSTIEKDDVWLAMHSHLRFMLVIQREEIGDQQDRAIPKEMYEKLQVLLKSSVVPYVDHLCAALIGRLHNSDFKAYKMLLASKKFSVWCLVCSQFDDKGPVVVDSTSFRAGNHGWRTQICNYVWECFIDRVKERQKTERRVALGTSNCQSSCSSKRSGGDVNGEPKPFLKGTIKTYPPRINNRRDCLDRLGLDKEIIDVCMYCNEGIHENGCHPSQALENDPGPRREYAQLFCNARIVCEELPSIEIAHMHAEGRFHYRCYLEQRGIAFQDDAAPALEFIERYWDVRCIQHGDTAIPLVRIKFSDCLGNDPNRANQLEILNRHPDEECRALVPGNVPKEALMYQCNRVYCGILLCDNCRKTYVRHQADVAAYREYLRIRLPGQNPRMKPTFTEAQLQKYKNAFRNYLPCPWHRMHFGWRDRINARSLTKSEEIERQPLLIPIAPERCDYGSAENDDQAYNYHTTRRTSTRVGSHATSGFAVSYVDEDHGANPEGVADAGASSSSAQPQPPALSGSSRRRPGPDLGPVLPRRTRQRTAYGPLAEGHPEILAMLGGGDTRVRFRERLAQLPRGRNMHRVAEARALEAGAEIDLSEEDPNDDSDYEAPAPRRKRAKPAPEAAEAAAGAATAAAVATEAAAAATATVQEQVGTSSGAPVANSARPPLDELVRGMSPEELDRLRRLMQQREGELKRS
eukprot:tig00020539_g10397.t1